MDNYLSIPLDGGEHNILLQSSPEDAVNNAIVRCKVLDLLEIMQFRSLNTLIKHPEVLSDKKFRSVKCNLDNPRLSSFGSEVELTEVK
ncbi:hypothetical protein Tco_0332090 [Tanacetum coccineum]